MPGKSDAVSKRWGLVAFGSGVACAFFLWQLPTPERPAQIQSTTTVTVSVTPFGSLLSSGSSGELRAPSLRAGVRDESPQAYDASTHAFFIPGTLPGSEESLALAAAWPSDEALTLVFASPQGACRGTTAGAWRLADERDARDLGNPYVTQVTRNGDCPIEALPLLALRGVTPSDVIFVPSDSTRLTPRHPALREGLARLTSIPGQESLVEVVSVSLVFRVRDGAYAAIRARAPGELPLRWALVSLPLDTSQWESDPNSE